MHRSKSYKMPVYLGIKIQRSILLYCLFIIYVCFAGTSVYAAGDTTATTKAANTAVSTKNADEVFAQRDYAKALNLYSTSLSADPANPNLNFKVALCHLYLLHQPKLDIQLLKTAIRSFQNKYDFYNDKQNPASVDAYYFLGKSFMYSGQIDSGMTYLIDYLDLLHNNVPLDVARQLKMCINAKELMKSPRQFNVRELGKPVNSGYDESHPVLSLDNKVLFFASRRPSKNVKEGQLGDDDIYYALATSDSTFGTPQAFLFNTEFDDEPLFLSANGNTLYFRRANKDGIGDIYISEKTDNKWGEPKKMNGVNSNADEQGISISTDGTQIVVSSDRPGGAGGYDLYTASGKSGNWGTLKNMGPSINTDMDEISPFIFPGGKRIYFSSNGNSEHGMGGFDILYTETDSAGKKWISPKTLGYPVNTSGNEFDYVLGSLGRTIYTAVGRNGDLDLFDIIAGEFKPEIQDQIKQVRDSQPLIVHRAVKIAKPDRPTARPSCCSTAGPPHRTCSAT